MGSCCSGQGHDVFPRNKAGKTTSTLANKECGICFVLLLAATIAIGIYGFIKGDRARLTHGVDWQGNVCGAGKMADYKFTYFCGSSERVGMFPKYLLDGSTACVKKCPEGSELKVVCLQPAFHNFTSFQGGMEALDPKQPTKMVNNVETLEMTVTQSAVKQVSYPTEEFGGRFCVPSRKANKPLWELLVHGPWGHRYRPLLAMGSVGNAWPCYLIVAGVSAILSLAYFTLVRRCAGFMMFISMILSAVFCAAVGLSYLFAIFMSMNDPTTTYAKWNPILTEYQGEEARAYSIIVGMVFVIISCVLAIVTMTSMRHVDEVVGLIAAAQECITYGYCTMGVVWPLSLAGAFMGLIILLVFIGLPPVASLAELNGSNIVVNGHGVAGLQHVWQMMWYQKAMYYFYLAMVLWILEVYVQWSHYVVAYVVASYYFTPVKEEESKDAAMLEKLTGGATGKKNVEVRVGGIDQNYGMRQGQVFETRNGKILVTAVGKKGPGVLRAQDGNIAKKSISESFFCTSTIGANMHASFFHLGAIALGAPIIAIMRPFRFFAQCVSGFLHRSSPDPDKGPGFDAHPGNANLKGCFALFSACMDQVFGKYCKHAYIQLVLTGGSEGGFMECTDASFQLLTKSGGSLAYLHGSMMLYEIIACLWITVFCGVLGNILVSNWGIFDPVYGNPMFRVEDRLWVVGTCSVIAFAIAFAWVSIVNQTADVLLYCVAWNRKNVSHGGHGGHGGGHGHAAPGALEEPIKYCPQALRDIIPEYELKSHYEHGIHAHGVGQMSAIIMAMEHGAMNTSDKGRAPNYSSAMGSMMGTMKNLG
jgi:hypothetical protein